MTSPTDMKQHFTNQELTKIQGRPTRTSLSTLWKELKANLRKIYSTNGCGTRGHLRLFYGLTAYNALPTMTANKWVDPVHSGATPVIPIGANQTTVNRILQEYKSNLLMFNTQETAIHICTQMVMNAVEVTYYQALEDPDEGYAEVNLINIMDHLNDQKTQMKDMRKSISSTSWTT